MHLASPHFARQEIKSLQQTLPLFDPKESVDLRDYPALEAYIGFYQLPYRAHNSDLFAGRIVSGEQQTYVMVWKPADSKGSVILVHGYLDHTGLYGHIIEDLLSRGLTVVCFDLIGHGLSSGEPASIEFFAQYVSQLNQVIAATADLCPTPLHGIGQSTGGAILLKQLIEQGQQQDYPFVSLDLLAPLVQPALWSINRWLFKLTRPFRKTMKRVFRANSHDPEFLHFIRHSDPFQPHRLPADWVGAMADWVVEVNRCASQPFPINVIQGNNDGTLDWKHNMKLLQSKFPNMQLHLIPGAGHHMVNEAPALREKIFSAIKL